MRYKIYLINGQGIISFSARVHLISVVMISDASQKIIQFLRTWGKNYSILVEPIFSVGVWVYLIPYLSLSHILRGVIRIQKNLKKYIFKKSFGMKWKERSGWSISVEQWKSRNGPNLGQCVLGMPNNLISWTTYILTILWLLILKRSEMFFFF